MNSKKRREKMLRQKKQELYSHDKLDFSKKRQLVVDVSSKDHHLCALEKTEDEIRTSIDEILEKYYSNNAEVDRIMSRSLGELLVIGFSNAKKRIYGLRKGNT